MTDTQDRNILNDYHKIMSHYVFVVDNLCCSLANKSAALVPILTFAGFPPSALLTVTVVVSCLRAEDGSRRLLCRLSGLGFSGVAAVAVADDMPARPSLETSLLPTEAVLRWPPINFGLSRLVARDSESVSLSWSSLVIPYFFARSLRRATAELFMFLDLALAFRSLCGWEPVSVVDWLPEFSARSRSNSASSRFLTAFNVSYFQKKKKINIRYFLFTCTVLLERYRAKDTFHSPQSHCKQIHHLILKVSKTFSKITLAYS